jgi:non-specific serine/threonine protein kinase
MQQGAWTDIYALGGVLYHAMTGKVPVQAISRMMADPLKDVAGMARGQYSQNLCQAVMKCLAVMPENRFQSIDDLRSALGWVTTPVSSTVIVNSAPAVAAPRPQAITPAPVTAPSPAMQPAKVTPAPSLDPLANLGLGAATADIAKAKTAAPASTDLDEITVVGPKVTKPKTAPQPPAGKSSSASPAPPVSAPITVEGADAAVATAKKGLSPGLLIGGGLGLIAVAIAAFFLTGRGGTPPPKKAIEPAVADVKPSPPVPVDPAPTPIAVVTPGATNPAPPTDPAPVPGVALPGGPTPGPGSSNALPGTPADAKTDVADTGKLRITVSGGWAEIKVNGETKGTTPKCCSLEVPPGSYTVEFSNPNKPPVTKTVEVVAGKTATARHAY